MNDGYFKGWRFTTIGMYLAAFVTLVDQGTKMWVHNTIAQPPRLIEISPYLNLTLVWNRGVTFGLFDIKYEYMPYVFISIALVIVLFLINWMMRANSLAITIGLGMVMGGAVGNIIDRVRYGAVIDFIDAHWGEYHWYVFNIADSAVVCGVIILLIENVTKDLRRR